MLRVLHLISNHKFTGPVDPAIVLACSLRELGVDSRLAVGRSPSGRGVLHDIARRRGMEPSPDLELPKHRRFLANRRDARCLVELLQREPVDILHAHLDNAHETAARTCRYLRTILRGSANVRLPLVVRSLYDDRAPLPSFRYRRLYGREAAGVFLFGESVRRELVSIFNLPAERVVKIDGAVLAERFHPRPAATTLRERFRLPPHAVVVGIVARIQRHRRYEVLLEAMRRVMRELPQVYLLVLGRGTFARELAHERVKALGIEERVRLPGYVGGEDYPAALACFDIKVFLVPGSDGTCRAVREAMATGIPLVVSSRGLLPEIVRNGEDGFVVDDAVEPLAAAIHALAADPDLRRRMSQKALERARESFSPRKQAEDVVAVYQRWLGSPDLNCCVGYRRTP